MTSAFSWQNSISLCPASFCIPRPNLPVTPGVSWLPTFAFHSPIMKRTSFLGVSSKRSLGLHRTVQLQLLQHYWLGHRLGLLWYWMVCLGNEQRSFCRFWDCIQVLHFRSFVDHDGYSISSEGFLPAVVDIMVIWVKFTHSSPFEFADSYNVDIHSCHLLFDHFQFALIHGPDIPCSYAMLLFTASELWLCGAQQTMENS